MEDSNPLMRALALRTISYVHVREFVEATIQPVRRLMDDIDPYVRKTAAFCVAKLYEHDKKMVESSDLIDRLNRMLKDENPTVVSSVLASLVDIWGRSETISLTIDYTSASKLVSILPDCSEYVILPYILAQVLTVAQVGPNIYSRSAHVVRPARLSGGPSAGRTHSSSSVSFELCRRSYLYPCHPLSHELHLRRQACHLVI